MYKGPKQGTSVNGGFYYTLCRFSYFVCLLIEGVCHLNSYVGVRLFICIKVDAGNPLGKTIRRKKERKINKTPQHSAVKTDDHLAQFVSNSQRV